MRSTETATPGAENKRAKLEVMTDFRNIKWHGPITSGPVPHEADLTGCSKLKKYFRFNLLHTQAFDSVVRGKYGIPLRIKNEYIELGIRATKSQLLVLVGDTLRLF